MNQPTRFTDEQLTAYLDGEAADDLRRAIDAELETDGDLADQLKALDIDTGAIAAAFDDLLTQAPAVPDLTPTAQAANTNAKPSLIGKFALFSTGIAAGIAMMVMVGTPTPEPPKAPGWKAVVATYQSLYTAESFKNAAANAGNLPGQLAVASAAIGADISQLPVVQGLDFKRAQVLNFRGKPLVQLVFVRPNGTPVALCIIVAKSKDAKPMAAENIQGLSSASWNIDGLAYLLIGGDIAAKTQQEAQTFAEWSATVSDI